MKCCKRERESASVREGACKGEREGRCVSMKILAKGSFGLKGF
jgi:hypothetical protein